MSRVRNSNLFQVECQAERKDWVRLIAKRANTIIELASTFSLPTLGEMKWIQSGNCSSLALRKVPWESRPSDITFRTLGVFLSDRANLEQEAIGSTGQQFFCGLTRNGGWISGTIYYEKRRDKDWAWLQYPKYLSESCYSLESILDNWDPADVYLTLGLMIGDWHSSTRKKWNNIGPIYEESNQMDMLVRLSKDLE